MMMDFRLRINAILRDDDKARTVFNKEIDFVIEEETRKNSSKCFYTFIAGTLLSIAIFTAMFLHINEKLF